jgi:hypothetical protein
VGPIARRASTPAELEAALDALPGRGPVTVSVFLRELRGVWALADPPLGTLTAEAGRRLRVLGRGDGLTELQSVAEAAGHRRARPGVRVDPSRAGASSALHGLSRRPPLRGPRCGEPDRFVNASRWDGAVS